MSLGEGRYLEIIAPQAGAKLAARDEGMRALEHLRIVGWAVSVSDVEAGIKSLRGAGFAIQPPQPGSRVTPSGERLEWSTFGLADQSLTVAPFFIHWSAATKHPSTTAPEGCTLVELKVQDPAVRQTGGRARCARRQRCYPRHGRTANRSAPYLRQQDRNAHVRLTRR